MSEPVTLKASSEVSWSVYETRPIHERRHIAHIKRFMEHLSGDAAFREELGANIDQTHLISTRYKLDVDPAQLRPLWDNRRSAAEYRDNETEWPMVVLWQKHLDGLLKERARIRSAGDPGALSPAYSRWRNRQIARADLELGRHADGLVHPLVAYELSDGCSVGCWFCGISAKKFGGARPYDLETERLWRGILEEMTARFGHAAQAGFLYWATDPLDNPDYIKFLKSHHEITGFAPQTTTAVPLRDVERIREILEFSRAHRGSINRFSVLTTKLLRRVFDVYSPEELARVELVLHSPDSVMKKAAAGRAMGANESRRAAEVNDEAGTIACVTGFLVNLPNQTIKLVSPTVADETWPLGYRIYAEASFQDARDFGAQIDDIVAMHMRDDLSAADIVAFSPQFKFERVLDGFSLSSPRVSIQMPNHGSLASRISRGDTTLFDLLNQVRSDGGDPLEAVAFIEEAFRGGVLNENIIASVARDRF